MLRPFYTLLKNRYIYSILKTFIFVFLQILSTVLRLDPSLRLYLKSLVKNKKPRLLQKTLLFLMKIKFPALEKYNTGFHPANVQAFFSAEHEIFVKAIPGFIKYIERQQQKSFFHQMSLMNFYIVIASFEPSLKYQEKILAIYESLANRKCLASKKVGYNARAKTIRNLKQNFTIDRAIECLKQIEKVLKDNNVEYFLVSGTLLGAVRSGTFLSHDYDIDLGVVLDSKELAQLALQFERHPDFTVKATPPFRLLLRYQGCISIDIFNHVQIGDQYYHGTPDRFWSNKIFKLKKITFLGRPFHAPDDIDLYLTENYGDWKTPVRDYNAFFDTPNFLLPHNIYACLFFAKMLYFYYLDGDEQSFRKVISYLDKLILNINTSPLTADLSFNVPCYKRKDLALDSDHKIYASANSEPGLEFSQ